MIDLLELQRASRKKSRITLILLSIFLVTVTVISLASGNFSIGVDDIVNGLSPLQQQVLFELRFPRIVTAILVGAALAVAGCILQVLLANSLAEPGVIGISSFASLFAVLSIVLLDTLLPQWAGLQQYILLLSAFVGASLVTGLLYQVTKNNLPTTKILLLGVAIGIFSGAIMTWLLYFSDDSSMRQMLYWMMGNLAYGADLIYIAVIPLSLSFLWIMRRIDALNLLQFGEQGAFQSGIDVPKLRIQLILCVAVLTGISVSMAGVISFIGLVIPHILRILVTSQLRFLVPASALLGASFLLLADLIARNSFATAELPVGAITASLGAPFFIYLLLRKQVA
ncbi:MAG: vitamin B12 ABC transporter permease BtuC [Moritella sp.]|nr:vitamin B12 ABC transporter permease BtuC [Moritella sp.]